MNLVGRLPRTKAGNRHILVLMDYSTRWPEAIPLHNRDSKTIADEIAALFARVGVPEEILPDCGTNFVSRLMQELYRLLGVTGIRTMPYHPECDGLVECFNASMKGMLRKGMLRKVLPDWDGQWNKALLGSTGELQMRQRVLRPQDSYMGQQIRGPLQTLRDRWVACESTSENVISYVLKLQERKEAIQEAATKNEREQKKKYKRWYDQKARERSFKAGELVLLRTPLKQHGLNAEWAGPYAKKHSDLVYELYMPEHPRRRGKYHVNWLEPYNSPTAECLLADGVDTDTLDPPSDKGSKSISQLFLNPVLTSDQKKKLNKLLQHFGDIHG